MSWILNDQEQPAAPAPANMPLILPSTTSYAKSVYLPLSNAQSIRLLKIHPGQWEEPLVCSLVHASISEPDNVVPYTALSYCWGTDSNVATMTLTSTMINNTSTTPTAQIQEIQVSIKLNLFIALRYLRTGAGDPRVVWVDALCINQQDIQERNQQVSIIQNVYSCATDVCIWLGEESEKARVALEILKPFTALYESDASGFLEKPTPHVNSPHSQAGVVAAKYREIGDLFGLPWFSRVWVLQEVFNAKTATVRIGNESLPWDLVFRIGACIRKAREKTRVTDVTLPDIFFSLFETHAELSKIAVTKQYLGRDILSLVMSGLDLDATDPRDKIFALLPIWKDTGSGPLPDAIRPDYSKETSQVFADFTVWWIQTYQSLRILSTIHGALGRTWQRMTTDLTPELPDDRPSWSMWHTGRSVWLTQGTLAYNDGCRYTASGSVVDELGLLKTRPVNNVLQLQGIQIGCIEDIQPYPWGQMHSLSDSNDLAKAFDNIFDPAAVVGTWTPAGSIAGPQGPDRDLQTRTHIYCHEIYDDSESGAVPCISRCLFSGKRSYITAIANSTTADSGQAEPPCRNLELTGLCPYAARVGDIIVVLVGGNIPYVIRGRLANDTSTAAGENYGLVGECFVEGYMNGEAITQWKNGKLQMETFDLL